MPGARAGLRPPAFSRGWPMPRFHAALGMVSPAKRNCVQVMKPKKSRNADTPRANILTIVLRLNHDDGRKTIFYNRREHKLRSGFRTLTDTGFAYFALFLS